MVNYKQRVRHPFYETRKSNEPTTWPGEAATTIAPQHRLDVRAHAATSRRSTARAATWQLCKQLCLLDVTHEIMACPPGRPELLRSPGSSGHLFVLWSSHGGDDVQRNRHTSKLFNRGYSSSWKYEVVTTAMRVIFLRIFNNNMP